MASVRDIVNGSLRKIGRLAGGREPRTQDSSDALDALRGLYQSLINSGAFGRLYDVVPTGASYTAGENQRIFRNSDVTLDITLPELVRNECSPRPYDCECPVYSGQTVTGDMRPPRDCSVVVITDAFTSQTVEYIYDGNLKQWQSLYDLELDSQAPISHRDPEGLKCALATVINDEFGGTLGQTTITMAAQFRQSLATRFSMPSTIAYAEYF